MELKRLSEESVDLRVGRCACSRLEHIFSKVFDLSLHFLLLSEKLGLLRAEDIIFGLILIDSFLKLIYLRKELSRATLALSLIFSNFFQILQSLLKLALIIPQLFSKATIFSS